MRAALEASPSLRMGSDVPVPTGVTVPKANAPAETVRSYIYRQIGTNIDVAANTASEGRYSVRITLNDSRITAKGDEATLGAPLLRNFTSLFFILLRDGQTATNTSATDPLTGETIKIEVTLTVLK